ncbi:serine hydrolase [Pedobacter cryoconitis]|uniref:serine hydrolase n=1 Tax=Pedobacter cryoconitis TaxID=188932 RepID=UPI00161A960C|nr:serine hydrolase [Pedobacter cryoconitis]MBB5645028.1 CubicO group peptidase (beta-lactamase class C family) [Pedobacter cryoconitis]
MKLTNFKVVVMLLFLTPLMTLAQSGGQRKSDLVVVLIKKYITEKRVDQIYALGSKSYKSSISQEKLADFFEKNIYILGKIKESSLISPKKNLNRYKLEFEAENIELSFSLDQNNKLTELSFSDFVPVITKKITLVPSSNPLKSKLDKEINTLARSYIQNSNTVGLSIGILKDGKTYTYGYGSTQKKNGVLPDANTIFEIGSISKTFTAQLLAWYVSAGKISLTDPITKYLPDSVAANPELQQIKVVNLSNHTSGLVRLPENLMNKNSDAANPYKSYTKELLFSYLKSCKLASVPGEVYSYSNTGTGLLGVILERISGKTYEELVKEIITDPLKMNSTFQHLTPELAKRFAKVYNLEAKEVKAWDLDALVGAGGLRSTVNDMLIYADNNIESKNPDLAKAFELTHQVTFSKDPMVGLGWHIMKPTTDTYYWHNGGTGGSRSFIIININKKTAVVVLSNSQADTDNVGVGIIEKL